MTRLAALLALVAAPALASAADATPGPDASGIARGIVGLAIVIGLILVTGWAVRRLNPQQARASNALRIVATQSLGARERVVVVEIAETWLVVGVAPGRVQSLATLPRTELPAPASIPGNPFGSLLERAIRGRKDAS